MFPSLLYLESLQLIFSPLTLSHQKQRNHFFLSLVSDLIRFVPFSHRSPLTLFSNYLHTVHFSEHSAVATSFRSTKPNKQHLSLSISVLSLPLLEPSISNSSCYQVRFSLLFSFKILLTYLSLSLSQFDFHWRSLVYKDYWVFFSFFIFPQFFFFYRLFSHHLYDFDSPP